MKINRLLNINKKGFTIIELIVCMAIIAVLSSFMIPKLLGYTDKAEDLKNQDTGRKLYSVAMESYVSNDFQIDNDQLQEDITSLLGVGNVESCSGTSIEVKVDGVTYLLNLDSISTDSAFTIEE